MQYCLCNGTCCEIKLILKKNTYIHKHIEKHVSNRNYKVVTNTLPMCSTILLYVLWFSRLVNGMERMSQTHCASHTFPNLYVVIYTNTVTSVREIMTYWPTEHICSRQALFRKLMVLHSLQPYLFLSIPSQKLFLNDEV